MAVSQFVQKICIAELSDDKSWVPVDTKTGAELLRLGKSS